MLYVNNFCIKKFNLTFEDNIHFFDIKRIRFLNRELKSFRYIKEKKNEKTKEIEEEEKKRQKRK